MNAIQVLVVDDSAVARKVIGTMLERAPGIQLLHAVADPLLAIERMKRQWPDVIVLDVAMPRMDGITFLKRIMAERPTPVVICATLSENGAATAAAAMAAGAVAVIAKPRLGLKDIFTDSGDELVAAVRAASGAKLRRRTARAAAPALPVAAKLSADAILAPASEARPTAPGATERVIAIGTSTGGTMALEDVLTALPPTAPGIVVVQHMPEKFTAAFAERLDKICRVEVREARHGDRVLAGRVLIAPGGQHMLLRRDGSGYQVEVIDGPPVNRHRPSVDVLFRSVARQAGPNALGIIMTGMGDDGAAGLLEMRLAGAHTVAQDEESCVVYGMPKEAVRRGAAQKSLPLQALAREILQQGQQR